MFQDSSVISEQNKGSKKSWSCLKEKQETEKKVMHFVGDWLVSVRMHLALDVHGVQLPIVVLGDDLHYILLLKGIFIHPLHGTHTLDRD